MGLSDGDKLRMHLKVGQALAEARKVRYPVVLAIGQGEQVAAELWREFADGQALAFLDLLQETMNPEFRRVAQVWPVLVDWIRERAIEGGGLVVVEIDVVATAWNDDGRERFFRRLLRSETRVPKSYEAAPIVAVSQLGGQCDLPRGSRNHGIVVDLAQ